MKKITKFLDITLWVLVALEIIGGGFSAYVMSSFWAGGNGGKATTIYPDRLDRDASDRSNDRLSLDRQRPTQTVIQERESDNAACSAQLSA
ncbi:hypothetical protein, partial [Nostoc sp. 'Peltigera malacea cyanobiont' DB3992]|uniref:hypothetical protein n=1 Tax=Nostoc sp. 'Peltigera malacea cyanobiont' DB3992 TaxID=1206980 RepID=UPI0015D4B983